ncbi:CHC2 zinc finger domain-containing protein, partial [Patescibacteria group bacterium]
MPNELEEIKNRIDLVELISSYVPVKKSGRNHKALCPFHNEKTPSLMISSEKHIWHCFGCAEGGDHFGWVMKMEGVDFGQALKILADKAGVKLQKDSLRRVSEQSREKEKLYNLNQITSNFYNYLLTKHNIGKSALEY